MDDAITKWVATGAQFKETNRSRNNGAIPYEIREALRMDNYMTPDYIFEVLYGVGTDAHYVAPGTPLMPGIDHIIFNNPATIVYWTDGTKTVVKAHGEEFSEEHGLAMAFARKVLEACYGNKTPRAGFKRLVREAKHC